MITLDVKGFTAWIMELEVKMEQPSGTFISASGGFIVWIAM